MAITDLRGTKWLLDEDGFVPTWDTGEYGWGFPFTITFVSNETTYSRLSPYLSLPTDTFDIQYDSTSVWEADYNDDDELVGAWIDQSYRVIHITGGTDATNATLIAWLEANAEQIIEPTGNEYTITQNLTNLTSGNITLTITPDEGYALPAQADIVVTGGTIVSYDDTTGELVVTAGTTAVEVTCESAVSTISFSISGTTYQAEEGMTWAQWVASEYNTDGYKIVDNSVYSSDNNYYVTQNIAVIGSPQYVRVGSADTIVSAKEYVLGLAGGGGSGD